MNQLAQYHSESRPIFVLITEFVAFVGTMATIVGIGRPVVLVTLESGKLHSTMRYAVLEYVRWVP